MERLKQAGSINTGRGGPLGTRVFGQELTNLKDLLRIGKENQDLSRQKSTTRILSSRITGNYATHTSIINEMKERCTHRGNQSQQSIENLSKNKYSTRNDKFDSNNVWHQVNIEPVASQDKSLAKERTQSLHHQKQRKECTTTGIQQNYSMLRNIVQKDSSKDPISRQKTNNPTFHLNLSNLSLTYRLLPPARASENNTTQYTTVRFNDLKTVMDSIDQKLFYNSETLIDTIDRGYEKRPEHVSPYAQESFKYIFDLQKKFMPKSNYFEGQTDINKHMRSILLDWLIDVQQKFRMRCETFHLTVNLLDRYLSLSSIKRNKLQLVGVGAMLVAAKIEEIYAPQVRDLSFMTEHAYSKQEIINIESQIISTLDFQLNAPTIYSFLNRYQTLAPISTKHLYLAQFITELVIIQGPLEYLPSQVAAGAMYLIRKIKKYEPVWPKELILSSEYEETQTRNIAKLLCVVLQTSQQSNCPAFFQSVVRKYGSSKYQKVSMLRTKPSQPQQQTSSTVVHDTEPN